MSLVLVIALAPLALFAALLFPALSVQFALKYWFRPAERVSLEEAWSVRFDEHLSSPSSAFQG
jgi:hypothetical protein